MKQTTVMTQLQSEHDYEELASCRAVNVTECEGLASPEESDTDKYECEHSASCTKSNYEYEELASYTISTTTDAYEFTQCPAYKTTSSVQKAPLPEDNVYI